MKQIKVAVDVDNVLADFTAHFIQYYNRVHPDDIISESSIVDYDFNGLKYNAENEELWLIPGFISSIPLRKNAEQGFLRLCENFDVIVVTACDLESVNERNIWFANNFPWFDRKNIIIAERKNLINFDYIIDDSPFVLQSVGKERGICVNHAYNQHLKGYHRINDIEDAIHIIKKIHA